MSFVSYAQNREDVLLWRALGHVVAGFYVDVGANHPTDDSVTKAFYDRGWSGINIEPLAVQVQELQAQRPRDLNLCLAVGATEGEIELFDTPVRGLATASAEVAEAHRAQGLAVRTARVPLRRLDAIFAEHAPADVHFLKIDVEGFEADVLRGMDFARWRPWLVVVEATHPNSSDVDAHWEPLLTRHAYRCVFFDGLNRYYQANEHPELAAAFAAPPNVFDGFEPAEQVRLRLELQETQGRLARLEQARERDLEQLRRTAQLENDLTQIYKSTSWRITKPLRKASDGLRFAKQWLVRFTSTPRHIPKDHDKTPAEKTASPAFRWHACALPHRATAPLPPTSCTPLPAGTGWRLVGHVEGHYSLAVVNRGLAVALQASGTQPVQWVGWHGQRYEPGNDLPADQAEAVRGLLAHRLADGAPVVSLVHHYPLLADEQPADLRLALFFWEETQVPADMVAHLQAHTDGVLVASRFVRRALRHSGYSRPIAVVPMGLPGFALHAHLPATARAPAAGERFRFLHVSSAFERKGVDLLLQAFFARFAGCNDVELVLKTFANPHHDVAAEAQRWQQRHPNGPWVEVNVQPLDEDAMLALYESAHAMVLPTRGEGFNLPAAEALALGLPLVVTGFGGQADFATRQTAALLPYRLAPSRSHLQTRGAFWAEPDVDALAEQMARVRQRVLAQDAELNQARQAAADWVRHHYRWEHAASAVVAAAGQWWPIPGRAAYTAKKRRLVLLSPWQTACGIAEYAQALLAGWENTFELEVLCDLRTPAHSGQTVYRPVWGLGDSHAVQTALQGLLARPAEQQPDVLVVQHQQSLFLLTDEVCHALAQLRAAGVVVVLELHSTLPLVREGRISDQAAADLRALDLVVVHKLDDVNQMLGIGLVDNVMCLPLGVSTLPTSQPKAQRADWGLGPDDLVLGCFGFLLPHKGLDVVIASLPLLAKASGRQVRLLAVTAALDPRSQETLATCQRLAEQLNVNQHIVWVTDFRPITECLGLLQMADMHLYVYGPTRESASGAVTVGLATRRPVLVSPQGIFSDVQDCTYRLAGQTPDCVVQGVMALLQSPPAMAELQARQQDWLEERRWDRVSARLKAAVEGLAHDRQYDTCAQMTDPPRQRQLLVDVSELVFRDAGTGIQRVVHSVLREWLDHPPEGWLVCPVYALAGGAYCHSAKWTVAGAPQAVADGTPVQVGLGDVFVGLDLSAHLFPAVEAQFRAWRLAGVRVCHVVYDIIPLQYPQWFAPGMQEAFTHWLQGLGRVSDRLVCISNAVAQDVRLWLCGHAAEGALPQIGYFHLGADLPVVPDDDGSPAHLETLPSLTGRPTLLMVGTVEPRKGHEQALDAFELLWAEGVDVALVVVGKPGWMVEALCARMQQHPEKGRRLHWLEKADDAMLTHLYRHCSGLLAASYAEGFGLPLVEAAQHGLPILARDMAVFREVAGEHAWYFDGKTPQALAQAMKAWLALLGQGRAPTSRGKAWLNWRASAAQLLEAVL